MPPRKPPWRKSPSKASRKRGSTKLTAAEKERARKRAGRAGRRYPNLVDNMFVAKQRRERRSRGKEG